MNDACCDMMQEQLNFTCEKHADPFDCPDSLIYFSQKNKSYGLIIHDGGSSFLQISFCPWCGETLSPSIAKKIS